MKAIIFTDLDASLLHEETFSCLEIIDTLNALRSDGVLIVPNTSKTEIRRQIASAKLKFAAFMITSINLCRLKTMIVACPECRPTS